jgi:octaprenyl-diphosphate synthase
MQLKSILELIQVERQALDTTIVQAVSSRVPLVNDIGHYIIQAGGKRLRPLMLILCAKACGYGLDASQSDHISLAAIIEFIHTATLLHDDVVDESTKRRGLSTANAVWGNASSILVGDFLYSRAFQMMVKLDNMSIQRILSDATNIIAEGEVLQLQLQGNLEITEKDYFNIIQYKTATLFQAAAELGAVVLGEELAHLYQEKLSLFGQHFGRCYQIIDDVLDYSGELNVFGKNLGDDLQQGKLTLPLIYALQNGSSETQDYIKTSITQIIDKKIQPDLPKLYQCLTSSGAFEYAREKAMEQANLAKSYLWCLPDSEYKNSLYALTDFIISRQA